MERKDIISKPIKFYVQNGTLRQRIITMVYNFLSWYAHSVSDSDEWYLNEFKELANDWVLLIKD